MRRLLSVLTIALALCASANAQQDIPEVARSFMEEAERARDANRVDDAIAKYRRVIEAAPQLASAYVNLGALLHKQGKIEEADRTFAAGVAHAPGDRTLLSNAAATSLELGKAAEALAYVDRAIEMNKRDAALYTLRGTVLRALKRDEDAVAALQMAVQLSPRDARANFSLGNALYALGRKDEAIAAYRSAIDVDASMTRAHYNLGAVLFETGRYSEALGAYKVALDPIDKAFARNENVDPIHARAYSNLGAIYLRQQQWQPAADAYTKALRLDPASANTQYNLGFIFYNTNRFERAEEAYRKALALDPSLPLAYLHLAQIALRRGDSGGAASALQGALRLNPADADALVLLSRIRRRERHFDEALSLLKNVPPADKRALLARALLARDTGDLPRERAALEALIAIAPRPDLRAALAVNLVRQNAIDDARKQLDAAPPVVRALLLAADGRLAEAQKELGAAKSMLGAVVRRDVRELQDLAATDPTARGDLGLLLWQNGRGDQARPHLAAALASLPSWSEVALAAGELALTSRDYAHAVELLSVASKCDAPNALAVNADAAAIVVGKSDDICARAKRDLALAYIGEAAGDLEQFARRAPDSSAIRQARSAVDRAQNDDRFDSVALFLRGSFDLLAGDEDDARSAFTRALSRGLPSAAEAAAKKYVAQIAENAEAARAPEPESEATSATPRRTVVVFLPDAAAETEKKLIETMSSFVSQLSSSSGVPLTVEFFRRADDAREFIAANRDRVGVVVTNPEFAGDFKAQFQFSREGSRNYRRVVVVPSESSIKSSSDLRGRTLSIAEGLRDTTGAGANVVRSTDDLAAIANVLTGKTDAALVSEVNPLIVQNARRLRIVSTSGATPLPVVAFAPMPQPDREALTNALRSMSGTRLLAPLMISGLAAIEREPRAVAKKIDVVALSPRELGIPNPPDPPANIALRAMVQLPVVALNEEMFDTP